MNIDAAIDDLSAALSAFGMPTPRPPAGTEHVDEIERRIRPLALPGDLRRFWERVDPATFAIANGPRLCMPEFSLTSWRDGRWEAVSDLAPGDPPNLLIIGYESWRCLGIELVGPGRTGGSIWEWELDNESLRQVFDDLPTYLEATAASLRDGRIGEYEVGDSVVHIDDFTHDGPFRTALLAWDEADDAIDRNVPSSWPKPWQRAAELDWSASWVVGANTTIAELLASDPASRPRGRFHAEATIVDEHGATISDGTGQLSLDREQTHFVPHSVGERLEFDISVGPNGEVIVYDARPLH